MQNATMRVLVTGGTGFVGGWTAKAIADAGHSVRFLVRNPARLKTSVAKLGVDVSDFAVADISDRDSVREALNGCDAVVHSAALVATDPRETSRMLSTNMAGAQNVLGQAVELGMDPIVHVSSFTALFRPNLATLSADLPVAGGTDGYGQSKAQIEIYARGLQDAGAPVNITYPGMVLGPPVGDQFGEAGEGVRSALWMHVIPGRGAAWLIVDVRDVAALHAALLESGRGPRRYTAGGHRIPVPELAKILGEVAGTTMLAVPVPDSALRVAGSVLDQAGPYLPFNTPFTAAGMQYYTQMPESDDSPSEKELGITPRSARHRGRHRHGPARPGQLTAVGRFRRFRVGARILQPLLQPEQFVDDDADAQEDDQRHHNSGGHVVHGDSPATAHVQAACCRIERTYAMKAVTCTNAKLKVVDRPSPAPAKGQLLLDVLRCGICGSDLHARLHCDELADVMAESGYHAFMRSNQQVVFGHEFCGEVVDYGPGTRRTPRRGTPVVAMPLLRRGNKEVHGIGLSTMAPGAYAERLVVEQSLTFPVPNGLAPEIAALTEPMAVGWHAVRRGEVGKGDVAIVIGCGPIGLAVICMLKSRGVHTVIASDFSPGRRALATACGADSVVDPVQDSPYAVAAGLGQGNRHLQSILDAFDLAVGTVERLQRLRLPWWHLWRAAEAAGAATPKRPVIFECVGVPGIIDGIIASAPLFSRVVVVGVCMGSDHIRPAMAINKEINLRFVLGYTPLEFRDTLHMLADGKVNAAPLITGTVGLPGVAAAFDALGDPEAHAKIMIDPKSNAASPQPFRVE